MSKGKAFIKNTSLLLLGKFSSQLVTFLLLPLYTNSLLASDYGLVELLQTYISLFVPVLTLRQDAAIFRYLIDVRGEKTKEESIITNSIVCLIIEILIFSLAFFVIIQFIQFKYNWTIFINIVILMCSGIILQILRGVGDNKNYTIASIIIATTTMVSNILFIKVLKFDASSILISSSIANVIGTLYVIFKQKTYKYIKIGSINKKQMIEMLKYSIPMIPNGLSWWVINVSDRTIISMIINTAANGIYSVSCKFSNLLNSLFSVFSMSWQETASIYIQDKDREFFFSKMINQIFRLFASISLGLLIFIAISFDVIIGEQYLEAYKYIPILLLSNVFNVLMGLLGGIYIALKMTKKISTTTIISAILNIVINLSLIKFIGLYAASVSTLVTYIVISIIRYLDIRKTIKIKLDIKSLIIFLLVYCLMTLVYYKNNIILNIISLLGILVYLYFYNVDIIKTIIEKIKEKLGRTING